jgi:flagellar biosynthesis protein FlhF
MLLETFRGSELSEVMRLVRETLGEDAVLIRTRVSKRPGGEEVEVVAALAWEVEQLTAKLDGSRAAASRARERGRVGPNVIAFVGLSGGGKTTACMKVALSPLGVGHRKVGLVTMDTYRVGALEEIQAYAEIADLPLEVAYAAGDAPGALQRLRDRHVILVDTPGRGFGDARADWPEALAALDPDEVHLVVPAGLRLDVVERLTRASLGVRPTHILFTKLDELADDAPLAVMADAARLPARWVSMSPEVPSGLAPAGPRILSSLGIHPAHAARAAMAIG